MNVVARLLAVLAALVLVACGGGMEAGVGSGGSGAPVGPLSVGVGSVTGFGSITVNGERHDETGAEILIDQRPDRPQPATVAAIRLGTHVELQHRDFRVAKATVSAELIGPVAAVGATTLVALGQTIRVNGDAAHPTAFDGFSALSDLAPGAVVEVHGDRKPDGEILATRIEVQPTAGAAVRLAGSATAIDGQRFSVGALAVDASGATVLPTGASVAAGQRVIAWTDVPYNGGPLVAKVIRIDTPTIVENASVALDGVVADLRDSATFRIGGVTVNAAAAAFTGGSSADLSNGRSVRVRGPFVGGVLKAATVEVLPMVAAAVELTGAITDFVDAASSFRIRATLVRVTPQTTYTGGTAANLGTGVQVKAAGALVDGVVQATTVEFPPVETGPQRVIVGAIGAPVGDVGADGSRTFRVEGAPDVKTTTATAYRNGSAADIAAGRQVRVKGRLESTLIVAEELEFLDSPASTVEIEGTAANVRPTSMVVNGETVQLAATTVYTLNGEPATIESLKNGLRVQVMATRLGGALTAVTVEIRSPESAALTVRGIVSGRASPNATEFLVGSQRVTVSPATKILPANRSLADVVNGADVEVQGTIANGVLTATRLQFR